MSGAVEKGAMLGIALVLWILRVPTTTTALRAPGRSAGIRRRAGPRPPNRVDAMSGAPYSVPSCYSDQGFSPHSFV